MGTKDGPCDVYFPQLLAQIFGFEPADALAARVLRGEYGDRVHGKLFLPDKIGRRRYNAAKSALSRAVQRLEARGLIRTIQGAYCNWHGIELVQG